MAAINPEMLVTVRWERWRGSDGKLYVREMIDGTAGWWEYGPIKGGMRAATALVRERRALFASMIRSISEVM